MISFFRTTTLYKFILLFFLFLALRLPALLFGIPLLNPEIKWLLVGERMGQGFALYTQIWDNTAPLSALVFWLIDEAFGKSLLAHQIIASLLIFIQAILFNQILQRQQVFMEITQIPALLYVVLMSYFIDFYILSPILLANTFMLWVMNYIFTHISERRKYNAVFEIGAYIGIATLFYLPSFLMLAVPIIAFLLYSGTKFRDYLLMIFSFLFTLLIAFLGFYMVDAEYEFYLSFFQPLFSFQPYFYVNLGQMLLLFALPLLLVGFNFLKSPQYRRYTNYQNRCQTIMNFWVICALLTIFFDDKISAYSFMLAIPAIAVLLTHYFLMMQNQLYSELGFTALLGIGLYFTYTTIYKTPLIVEIPFTNWGKYVIELNTNDLVSKPNSQSNVLKNKKILVLGKDLGFYIQASLATPYLDWRLAERHFANMDKYNILINIYQNFQRELPDVIVDENGNAQRIFKAIPLIAKQYEKMPKSNFYIRKQLSQKNK